MREEMGGTAKLDAHRTADRLMPVISGGLM